MTEWLYTEQAPDRFIRAFSALAATKGTPVDDVKQEAFFSVLKGLPIEAVEESGEALQREPGPFLPDPGTWFTKADLIAAEQLERATVPTGRQLTAGRDAEDDEMARTLAARNRFLQTFEQVTGRVFPPDHPMRTRTPKLPTYGCLHCEDLGWVQESDGDRYRRCHCFHYNPVLKRRRVGARVKAARSRIQ
jgi:hypothetical protein